MNLPLNYTHELLVRNAIMNARPNSTIACERWVAVRDTFATGSSVAVALCKAYELDPRELVPGVSGNDD